MWHYIVKYRAHGQTHATKAASMASIRSYRDVHVKIIFTDVLARQFCCIMHQGQRAVCYFTRFAFGFSLM